MALKTPNVTKEEKVLQKKLKIVKEVVDKWVDKLEEVGVMEKK